MAVLYYVTNYATKLEDLIWKRVAAAAEVFSTVEGSVVGGAADTGQRADSIENRTRQFLMRVANRIFTERPLSQVEVIVYLIGYRIEFSNNKAWAFLNISSLYWYIFRRWAHLRCTSYIYKYLRVYQKSIYIVQNYTYNNR